LRLKDEAAGNFGDTMILVKQYVLNPAVAVGFKDKGFCDLFPNIMSKK